MSETSALPRAPLNVRPGQLWRRKGTILLCILLGVTVSLAALKVFEPVYQVKARVWVERRTLPTEQESPRDLPKDFVPTQAEIMRSALIVRQALAELPEQNSDVSLEMTTQGVIERLTVDPLVGTQILSIRFRDKNEQRALATVEAIIEHYRKYVQQAEQESHQETLHLLTLSQRELETQLQALERQRETIQTQIVASSEAKDRAKVRQAWLADLGQSVAAATTRRLEVEQQLVNMFPPERLATINAMIARNATDEGVHFVARFSDSMDPELEPMGYQSSFDQELERTVGAVALLARDNGLSVDDPSPLRAAIQQVKSREIALSQKLGHKHPELRAVRQELALLERQLLKLVAAAPSTLRQQLASLQQQERELTDMYERELRLAQQEFDQGKATEEQLDDAKSIEEEVKRVVALRDENQYAMQQWQRVDKAVAAGKLGVVVRSLEKPVAIPAGLQASLPLVLGIGGLLGMVAGTIIVSQQRSV